MANHHKQDTSIKLHELLYALKSNDYSTIAASQPYEQSHQTFYHQSYQQYYQLSHRPQQFIQYCHNQIIGN
ncbi:unnamed protein product [Rotaria sordida]|uniref:Uncharacterized protein n=2 Tax=Rotaria sordida TaxID=392033 RepID=A0A816FXX5_9BILA|nr:unnamed protein product [Rotaria sordida]CAF1667707.1 unnamed protein product [Rotaria sordida]